MHNKRFSQLIVLLLVGFLSGQVAAQTTSNIKREKNWADQVVDTVVVGEPVWLSARRHKFLALYAPPAQAGGRGVILIHGRGVHPAWGFVDNLRADIAEASFHTLSLQMPILATDAPFGAYGKTFPEAFERIDAGIQYLKQKGVKHVLLIGHSSGAMTAVAYVAKHPQAPVTGIVAIGLTTFPNGPDTMQPALMLKSVHVPVLDIYGANDLHEVLSYNEARRAAAQASGNKGYSAVRVPDANHFFTDQYEALKKHVLDWLRRNA
ncbi:MAG: phospholipase, partial [Proteobacteria bacterium]|nr:phospholipase [Pseudomonadota bacterium]